MYKTIREKKTHEFWGKLEGIIWERLEGEKEKIMQLYFNFKKIKKKSKIKANQSKEHKILFILA